MTQVVSSILIPLLLLSQSLFSVPHSHVGSSIAEPDDHAARPHVHWCLCGGHADDESSSTPEEQHEHDHDSDAVYGGDLQFLSDSKTAELAKDKLPVDCVVYVADYVGPKLVDTRSNLHGWNLVREKSRPKCALYLQLLSIRC